MSRKGQSIPATAGLLVHLELIMLLDFSGVQVHRRLRRKKKDSVWPERKTLRINRNESGTCGRRHSEQRNIGVNRRMTDASDLKTCVDAKKITVL